MSHNYKDNHRNNKDNQWKQSVPVRKTILRNPEVPIKSVNFVDVEEQFPRQPPSTWRDELNQNKTEKQQSTSSQSYHEPRLNKITELRRSLAEIKEYESKTLESMQDLSKNSQKLVNREISSKLNFPSDRPIFKNLTKLDSPGDIKADKLIQKSARKVAENSRSRKTTEIREEINELISKLVDLEYKEVNKGFMTHRTPQINQLPGEDDFLGLSKFSSPNFYVSKKKFETEEHLRQLEDDITEQLFKSDSYLDNKPWEPPQNDPQPIANSNCKCLDEFYNEHSTCS